MSKRFTIAVIVLLAAGMIAPLWIVMKQRRTIAELQRVQSSLEERIAEIEEAETDPLPVSPEPLFVEVKAPPIAVALQPTPTNAEFEKLKVENERLKAQARRTSNQVSTAHRQARMAEDLDDAYVGPGTWVRDYSSVQAPSTGQRGISKIVISGEFPAQKNDPNLNRLKVRAWENCFPEECEWGEVPFFLTDFEMAGVSYRRGLASWTIDGITRYVLVTFRKEGMYIERIDSKDGRHVGRGYSILNRVN